MSAPRSAPLWLAGRPFEPNHDLEVRDKWTGKPVAAVPLADAALIDRALEAAVRAAPAMRGLAAHERREVLAHCVGRFEERRAELAELLVVEAGKTITDARAEVGRLVDTFRVAAQETAHAFAGTVLPLDTTPRARAHRGMWQRVPVGPCAFVSPFNFPLNLVAHKIAPAIAAGCPFVLKPASATPLGALALGEILAETRLPEGAFSILPATRQAADLLVTDPRTRLLSFTGSPVVGWDLKARAGRKKVVLELGGNAACIVDEGVDLEDAASRITAGAFAQAGQSCISVQRIVAHRSVLPPLRERLVAQARAWPGGDPRDPATRLSPLIHEAEARRVETWIQEAVAAGGTLLCGGQRSGVFVAPALLEDVPGGCRIVAEEVFGPVAVLSSFDRWPEALAAVNDGRFGLQAGVFTRELGRALEAWDGLEVGGVVVNDVPSFRADGMPYGGVKESGLGREGVRFAIEDMTEVRMLVIRDPTKR